MVTATGPIDAATSDPINVRRGVAGMVTAAVRITIAVQDGRPRPSAAPSMCESSISVRKKAFSNTSQMPAFALACGSERREPKKEENADHHRGAGHLQPHARPGRM